MSPLGCVSHTFLPVGKTQLETENEMTKAFKQKNFDARDAKHVLRELRDGIRLVKTPLLLQLAKALANDYKIPNKVMLKTMSRHIRLYRTN